MCSIVITFNENRVNTLNAMAQAVRHRGPDSFEVWTNERHGVAACRLVIFGDPKAGMIYQQGPLTILLNGEIYNYSQLWSELRSRGFSPKTGLESELIAALFQTHGPGFAAKLKGMFAIAILQDTRLLLVRDRFGIKPLYYARAGRKVIVSSEIKGVLEHPDVTPILNPGALEETIVFGYIYSQRETFFQGIYQVPPGAAIEFADSGTSTELNFGELPSARYLNGTQANGYTEAVQETRQRLINAADKLFAHGSQPKGLLLSGGLDSSTLALIARRELGYDLDTFTLADAPDAPDLLAAREVARALGTRHHEYLIGEIDYWTWLPDYVAHYESLMAGGVFHIQGGLAFHILTHHVSQHVKVAFSGEGADELFGGYYWIYTHPLGFSDRIRANLARMPNNPRLEGILERLFPKPEDEKTYRRNLFDHLLRSGLSNYHLQSVDRSAGAFGIEIRPLYLEDNLADWTMRLPIHYKVPDKTVTKKILRDAFANDFRDLGLASIVTRLKMGMPSALSRLDPIIEARVDKVIGDHTKNSTPFPVSAVSKMELLLMDTFEQVFMRGWNNHECRPPERSLLARIMAQL